MANTTFTTINDLADAICNQFDLSIDDRERVIEAIDRDTFARYEDIDEELFDRIAAGVNEELELGFEC